MRLKGKKVAVLAEEIYQEMELWVPYYRLKEEGAEVKIVAPEKKTYKSKLGYPVNADVAAADVSAKDFDGVVIPGGYAPDMMRRYPAILKLVKDCCEIIMEGARSGVMVNLLSQALSGATAPVTMAGTLVGHNSEVLSGIVLNQLTCKGSPVMYGSSTCPMDLKRSTATVGSPECGMISAAVAQIAQRYSIPSWTAGG